MSTMFSRALMVLRSLSLRTYSFTLCVIAGTLFLCMGFFMEPNIDISLTTTKVKKEIDTATASNLTISIEVESLSACSNDTENIIEIDEVTLDAEESESIDEETSLSLEDYLEFTRLVEAEAKSEDLNGKILVAEVVMNRVVSDIFPDTISEVINDPGQFDPVNNKYINYTIPSHEAKVAVMNALAGGEDSQGALYFQKSEAKVWGDKEYLFRYGGHSFYK